MDAESVMTKEEELEEKLAQISDNVDELAKDVKQQSLEFVRHTRQDLEMANDISFIKRSIDAMHIDIKDLSHIIRGNGTPGLTTRIAILEELKKSKVSSWAQFVTLIAALLASAACFSSATTYVPGARFRKA